MKKVIYVYPDCEYPISEFERLTDEEKLHVAKNDNNMEIYTLEGFQEQFNSDFISDEGFIYFV